MIVERIEITTVKVNDYSWFTYEVSSLYLFGFILLSRKWTRLFNRDKQFE